MDHAALHMGVGGILTIPQRFLDEVEEFGQHAARATGERRLATQQGGESPQRC